MPSSCQIGWGLSVRCDPHVSPEIFSGVKVWVLAWLLQDIQRLLPRPLWCCLTCVFQVCASLKGGSSPQLQFVSLWQILCISLYFQMFHSSCYCETSPYCVSLWIASGLNKDILIVRWWYLGALKAMQYLSFTKWPVKHATQCFLPQYSTIHKSTHNSYVCSWGLLC